MLWFAHRAVFSSSVWTRRTRKQWASVAGYCALFYSICNRPQISQFLTCPSLLYASSSSRTGCLRARCCGRQVRGEAVQKIVLCPQLQFVPWWSMPLLCRSTLGGPVLGQGCSHARCCFDSAVADVPVVQVNVVVSSSWTR